MGSKVAVIAIGGNSLIVDKQHEDVASQVRAVEETCRHIADMIERGWNVIITHGNGPQVGFSLRRNELAAHEVHTTPLDVIGADTQGAIGYMICQALDNEFKQRGVARQTAAVVTQVLVDRNDPAFKDPTKGIGGFTTREKADEFAREGQTVNYNQPNQQWLDRLTLSEAKRYYAEGHFLGQHGPQGRSHHRLPGSQPAGPGPHYQPRLDPRRAKAGRGRG